MTATRSSHKKNSALRSVVHTAHRALHHSGTIFSGAVAIITLISAYGGLIDPRTLVVPSMACLAYPIVALAALALALTFCLIRRYMYAMIIGLALLLATPVSLQHFPLNFSHNESQRTLRVMTYNLCGFAYNKDDRVTTRDNIFSLIGSEDPDVVFLQEAVWHGNINFPSKQQDAVAQFNKKYPHQIINYSDLAIISKFPISVIKNGTLEDDGQNSHYIITNVDVAGKSITLVNLHMSSVGLSSEDREQFSDYTRPVLDGKIDKIGNVRHSLLPKLKRSLLAHAHQSEELHAMIDSLADENLIICGDLNNATASFAYRTLRSGGARDAYADGALGFTNTFNAHHFFFHLDHIFYRGSLNVSECHCPHYKFSDHYPVVATFNLE